MSKAAFQHQAFESLCGSERRELITPNKTIEEATNERINEATNERINEATNRTSRGNVQNLRQTSPQPSKYRT